MKRQDDFAERRKKVANLSDKELYDRFWQLTEQVVQPMYDLGKKNTTPSVERSVLLRMGVSSIDSKTIVEACMDRGLMPKGAGHVLYKFAKEKGITITEAAAKLAAGEGWDDAVAMFKGGAK
ncbi:MAG: ornithine aminomutase subunit alpha [Anaerovoracaceae bacterium]